MAVWWPHLSELFTFAPDATEAIGSHLEALASHADEERVGDVGVWSDSLTDYLHVTAAEFALIPALEDPTPGLELPIDVGAAPAQLALAKSDCCPGMPHGFPTIEEAALWDVFLFAGDMAKARLVGVTSVEDLDKRFEQHLAALLELHARAPSNLGQAIAPIVSAQGACWSFKLGLLRQPSRIPDRVSRYLANLPLLEPG